MYNDEYAVSLRSVAKEQGLTILHAAKDFDSVRVRTADVTARRSSSPASTTTSTPSACSS